MADDKVLSALRTMAWERAKGELRGMLHTYYDHSPSDKVDSRLQKFRKATNEFIGRIEDEGL